MTATYPETADLRECRLYRIYGWDPRTNYTTKTLIYIGETVQEAIDRILQHFARQPWADTITGYEVDDQVYCGKDAVVAAEKLAVETERPLYNDEWNRGNPDRISLDDAKSQRWARDDAKRVPRWQPPAARTMYRRGQEVPVPNRGNPRPYGQVSSRPRAGTPAPAARRPLKPRQKATLSWVAAWVVTSLSSWLLMLHWRWGSAGDTLIGSMCVLPGSLLIIFLANASGGNERRRKSKPRSRRSR